MLAVGLLLPSCKDELAPLVDAEASTIVGGQYVISLEASAGEVSDDALLIDNEGEELRALNYNLQANAGKAYPKPKIALQDEQQISVVVLLSRAGLTTPLVKQLTWKWQVAKGNREEALLAKGLDLSGWDRHFADTQQDESWKMFCIVGGSWDETNKKVVFSAETDGPKEQGSEVSINAIYMSQAWTPIKVVRQGRNIRLEGKERIRLKNKTITLMYRATNKTGKTKFFRGFDVDSEKLSFSGEYTLSNLTIDQQPTYRSTSWRSRMYQAIAGLNNNNVTSYAVENDAKTDFFITCAVPQEANLKPMRLAVWAIVGKDHGERGKKYVFDGQIHNNQKGIKAGDVVSIHTVEVRTPTYGHPIEQFLKDSHTEETLWEPKDDVFFDNLLRNEVAVQHRGEYSELYQMPSAEEARIIFPGHRNVRAAGNHLRPLDPAIVKFDSPIPESTPIKTKENIKMWNHAPLDYNAEYKTGSGSVMYGLRFLGPEVPQGMNPNNPNLPSRNKWLSAYRYEEKPHGVLIRVRHLGASQPPATLDNIAQETFWDQDPGYGKREYRLFVPKGKYWTSTVFNRVGVSAVAVMRVKSKNERTIAASERAAYVTDTEHKSYSESPRFSRDKENPYFLITRPNDPLPNATIGSGGSNSGFRLGTGRPRLKPLRPRG